MSSRRMARVGRGDKSRDGGSRLACGSSRRVRQQAQARGAEGRRKQADIRWCSLTDSRREKPCAAAAGAGAGAPSSAARACRCCKCSLCRNSTRCMNRSETVAGFLRLCSTREFARLLLHSALLEISVSTEMLDSSLLDSKSERVSTGNFRLIGAES